MPWLMQMAGFAAMLIGIGLALWLSVWIIAILFVIGVTMVLWSHVQRFLIQKGMMAPPATPVHEETHITIVEGEFERVNETAKNITEGIPKE